jgi:beta-glucanase (GH16 family)
MNPLRLLLAALPALLCAACGGGGGSSSPTPPTDTTPPGITLTSSGAGTTAAGNITFTVGFSEDVGISFGADDVALTQGSLVSFSRQSGTLASVVVAPPAAASGALELSIAPNSVFDAAGNGNAQRVAVTQAFDTRPPSTGVPAGYALVWSDEFDIDGLPDPARWDYDTDRNRLGWYNNELQYYARDRLENARVSGGRLIITARRESLSTLPDWGGQGYSSARLVTRGKASWTYGFMVVRAKLPCGAGTWPAIWTLGTRGTWPDDGEIDIMEQVGSNPTRVFGTLHTLQSGGVGTGGETRVADACTAFHDYQLSWAPGRIEIGIDGQVYYQATNPGTGYAAWPFDYPQYLLLNIAIGGVLGGAVNNAIFPVTMEVEYVRVYQRP